jgi:hypothetical protein
MKHSPTESFAVTFHLCDTLLKVDRLYVFVTTPVPNIIAGNGIPPFGLFLTCREKKLSGVA